MFTPTSKFLLAAVFFLVASNHAQAFSPISTTLRNQRASVSVANPKSLTTSLQASVLAAPVETIKETVKERKQEKSSSSEREQWREEPFWEVRLYNDEVNTHEWVARCLVLVTGVSEWHSYQTTKQAHKEGEAMLGMYQKEIAELYTEGLRQQGIVVQMFPVAPSEFM